MILMRNLLIIIILILPLILISCSHEQFQSYLLDTGVEENRQVERTVESAGKENTASVYSDEIISFRKIYSTPLSAMDILDNRNIDILHMAKKDLESYYVIAKYLRKYNKLDDLHMFEAITREYISEGIDSLLKREIKNDDNQIRIVLFELQYLKSLLFYEFNDYVMACETLNNLDIQYSQNKDLGVDFAASRLNTEMPHMVLTEFKHMCNNNIMSNISNQKQDTDSAYK